MIKINERIIDMLKRHSEGGQKFFDALDLMIRSDEDFLDVFMDWSSKLIGLHPCCGCVLTGSFGRTVLHLYHEYLYTTFSEVIVVNGGLREGKPVELPAPYIKSKNFILLDDSYYSGKTLHTIEDALKKLNPEASISEAYVVYDGSKDNPDGVKSLFRYYDYEAQKAE